MSKYKYFKIHTIKDWSGEYWDVYEERKTQIGLDIYLGWPYSLTPKDGISGVFSFILTEELATYLQNNRVKDVHKQLGLSLSIIYKFRTRMGIQNKQIPRNDEWLLAHQNEIIFEHFKVLKEKYGMTRSQVYQHKTWLNELIKLPAKRKVRKTDLNYSWDLWYQEHQSQLQNLSLSEIQSKFNFSKHLAKKAYDQNRREQNQPTFSEEFKNAKAAKNQWLLTHQETLLHPNLTVTQIAEKFNKSVAQIVRMRGKLRQLIHDSTIRDQNIEWVLTHKHDLLNPELSRKALALKYDLTESQVAYRKQLLKKIAT